jgi:hypothetical protein
LDRALASGAKDCAFEPHRGHFLFLKKMDFMVRLKK